MLLYKLVDDEQRHRSGFWVAEEPIDFTRPEQPVRLGKLDGVPHNLTGSWLQLPDPVGAAREALSSAIPRSIAGLSLGGLADTPEVWAAGVTYLRSKEARMEESEGGGSFYDRVYGAERPELFLKATPSRVVPPGGGVRIRSDAHWNVPEPEIALVVTPDLRIVGYTLGNDMSSRDIEGENPLYLPQAKVYRDACALGPAILLEEEARGHRNLVLQLQIERDGEVVFSGDTETSRMKRRFDELVDYLGRDNLFPDGVFLLTGTGVVPPDDFTLRPDDVVVITAPEIGELRNRVIQGGASYAEEWRQARGARA